MATLIQTLRKLKKDTRGQELVEYALIAAFLVAAGSAMSPVLADNVSNVFSKVTSSLAVSGGSSGQLQ